ncbi:MAG: hypothetical protein HN919_11945 [Verrucomicrobia bacterium]|jgi:hypothetical protein|nr:hypothetical protein [Verrucomicrobiota bacterium]
MKRFDRAGFVKRTLTILSVGLAITVVQSFILLRPVHGPVGIFHRLGAPFTYPFYLGGPFVALVPLTWAAIAGICVAKGRWSPLGYSTTVLFCVLHNLSLFGGVVLANIGG